MKRKPKLPSVRIAKLSKFRPQTANANLHTERGLGMLDEALTEDGYVAPMTAAADGEIIDGSARLERSRERFGDEAIVIDHDGSRPIITRRTDIKSADSPEAKRIAFRANRIAEVDLQWSPEVLGQLRGDGLIGNAFTEKELRGLLPAQEPRDAEPQIDKAAELQQKWGVATGEMIQIGRHVLLCGDSGLAGDVFRLMGDKEADLGFTDPPYNIDYEYVSYKDNKSERDYEAFCERWFGLLANHSKHQILTIGKQNLGMWHRLTPITEVAAWVHKNGVSGGKVSNLSLWEPIIFVGDFPRDSRTSNLFEYELRVQKDVGKSHTCPKQLALWQDILEHYSKDGDLIVDFFAGSGTTLVAAENLNRTCYAMEISPEYCAVILERMTTAFPGIKIERRSLCRRK